MTSTREAIQQIRESVVFAAGLFGAMVALVVSIAWIGDFPDFGTEWILTGVLPTYLTLVLLSTVSMSGSEIVEVVRSAV